MSLHDEKTLLPTVLRESYLPWTPLHDDQAPAPRDADGWTVMLGHLRFRLDVNWDDIYWEEGDPPPPDLKPEFELQLSNTINDQELGSWTFPSLDVAVYVAETLHQTRVQDICNHLLDVRAP